MKLITEGKELSKKICNLIEKHKNFSFAVAWASKNTKTLQTILANHTKIKHGVIGTHFFQTDYEVLENFLDNNSVHFMLQPSGIFHPKAYIFWSDKNNWDIIIGSANMTKAAFEKNEEICIHLSSDDSDIKICNELKKKIEALWNNAEIMTEDKAQEYKIKKSEAKQKLKSLIEEKIYTSSEYEHESSLLKYNWNTFVKKIKQDKQFLQKRLDLLSFSTTLFQNKSFAVMEKEERKFLAGMQKYQDYDYGLFGHTIRAFEYREHIQNNFKQISRALNKIPNFPEKVTKTHFLNYKNEFLKLTRNNGEGIGKATFTRLLVMKRPDYFICINTANETGICKELNINPNLFKKENFPNNKNIIYDHYWEEIIQKIIHSVWWNSPCPKDKFEKQIWKYRIAMLDSIFYEG